MCYVFVLVYIHKMIIYLASASSQPNCVPALGCTEDLA